MRRKGFQPTRKQGRSNEGQLRTSQLAEAKPQKYIGQGRGSLMGV